MHHQPELEGKTSLDSGGLTFRPIDLERDAGALDACRVYADVDPLNVPCARAFLRAGFRFEGTLFANWRTSDGVFDSEIYATTRSV